ncbi:hypothetical protein AB0M28_23135 [Streptomyces sp. NPDC051940]|uniref:hypothetical protein n=1 Tax=Streptomyces sp. NPDC051940 TaxID=3155675 RepID=UPI0034173CA4
MNKRHTAAVLLTAALVLTGCTSGGSDGEPPEQRTKSAGSASPGSAAGPPTAAQACAVGLPRAWQQALADGEIEPPDDGTGQTLAEVGPGAAWTVLQSTGDSKRELVLAEGEGDGGRTVVRVLDDPAQHQVDTADFDGRWLAYDLVKGTQLQSPWELWAWDRETGTERLVAQAATGADGQAVPGPLISPVIRAGRVFWAQGTGGGKAAVYARDVAEEKPRRLYAGVVDTPFAAGGLLVWPQGDAQGRQVRLAAVAMDTLKPAELPGPVAALRDIRSAASDGRTWAWIAGEQPRLYVWQEGWPEPLALVRDAGAVNADQVRVGGDLVTWRTTEAAYALDLRSRTYTRLTPQYGYATARDGALGVSYADKGTAPVIQVVPAEDLPPLPRGC